MGYLKKRSGLSWGMCQMGNYQSPKDMNELCKIVYNKEKDELKRLNKHRNSPFKKRLDINKSMNYIKEKYPQKFNEFIQYINKHYQDDDIVQFFKDNNIQIQKDIYRKLQGEEKLSYAEKDVFDYLIKQLKDLEVIEEDNQTRSPDFSTKKNKITFEVKGGYFSEPESNEPLSSLMNLSLRDIAKKDISKDHFFMGVFYINSSLQFQFSNIFLRELLFSNYFTKEFTKIHGILFYFQQLGGNYKNKTNFFVVKNEKLKQILEKNGFYCLFIKEVSDEAQTQLIKLGENRNEQLNNQTDDEIYGTTEKEIKIIEESVK